MQFKPSRRLLLFCSAVLLLIALPLLFAALAVVRAVVVPPVRGARLIGYDGMHLDANCADGPAAKGRRVLLCQGYFHIDSRFEIINNDAAAIAWCIQRVDDGFFNVHPANQYGPLTVGAYPPIPRDWSECTQMLPMRVGMYAQILINH